MSKTVLMTGFHFPPSALSSGHLRFLAFAKYLPECGWDPVVLSATTGAYELTDPASVRSIPIECNVYRAFALDAKRHLAVMGKYPSLLALPDRWASWWPAAVWMGLRLIKRYRAQAIRSTARWERRVLSYATRSVFTTRGAMQWCAERFPEASRAGRLTVIANGYDEEAFTGLGRPPARTGRPLVLLHSGLLYPEGRSPVPFFAALARLRDAGRVTPGLLKVILRASGSEAAYAREIQRLGLGEMVTLAPPVGNHEALLEQAVADGLLLSQGSKFDLQIPAKVYEYLRIGQPIFALVGPNGDTATLLRESGGAVLVADDDVDAIATNLPGFLHALNEGTAPSPRPAAIAQYSRRAGTALLSSLLDQLCT